MNDQPVQATVTNDLNVLHKLSFYSLIGRSVVKIDVDSFASDPSMEQLLLDVCKEEGVNVDLGTPHRPDRQDYDEHFQRCDEFVTLFLINGMPELAKKFISTYCPRLKFFYNSIY